MLVSVAICTWNRAKLLDKTLAQFHSLRVPSGVEWELIVVNNDCTDETDRVIDSHRTNLPIVRLFEGKPGLGHARNAALREARGAYVLWTDDDVLVDAGWLEKTLEAFAAFDADLVYGKAEPWWEVAPPSWFSSLFLGLFALVDLGPKPFMITDRRYGFGVNFAFRTATLRALGGYRAELGYCKDGGGGGEDIDVFYRMLNAGKKIVFTPYSIVHHFIPSARCVKGFYRKRAWSGGAAHLKVLRSEAQKQQHLPTFAGVPRYFFRINLGYLSQYLSSLIRRDQSSAFFFELKLIALASLIREVFFRRNNSRE